MSVASEDVWVAPRVDRRGEELVYKRTIFQFFQANDNGIMGEMSPKRQHTMGRTLKSGSTLSKMILGVKDMKKTIIASAIGAVFMLSGQAVMADGKATYDGACFACHGIGVAGAPKFGDKGAWAPRIAKGLDVLKKHAKEGFKGDSGFMPAKGGRSDLADADVEAAVEYMVSQVK